jgi:hypothetical protein
MYVNAGLVMGARYKSHYSYNSSMLICRIVFIISVKIRLKCCNAIGTPHEAARLLAPVQQWDCKKLLPVETELLVDSTSSTSTELLNSTNGICISRTLTNSEADSVCINLRS